ncbi:Sorting nexin mvp-1 [Tolypocladium paradoxum]|uniref:Sorting nexin MVP1 n=1 Tax=Tolypocladium paradoxum TaxID=94208 RepID=A0A2S4L811_9HYPO|nr:Sorting nexin mvp-1 [Tolypocladium paradoxum]
MSLFGTSPTDNDNEPTMVSTPRRQNKARGGSGLFDEPASQTASSNGLFDDGNGGNDDSSPWDMPTPRKQQSRVEMIRNLLPASDVPDSYIETFDAVVREDGTLGRITSGSVAKLFANARLGADAQARIMSLVAPGQGSDVSLGRGEFNVVLALIGLAQEGDIISLDGVDERRTSKLTPMIHKRCTRCCVIRLRLRSSAMYLASPAAHFPSSPVSYSASTGPLIGCSPGTSLSHAIDPVTLVGATEANHSFHLGPDLPQPKLPGLTAEPVLPPVAELAAKPLQTPSEPQTQTQTQTHTGTQPKVLGPAMDDPEDDPWNSPEVHKGHDHAKTNGSGGHDATSGQNGYSETPTPTIAGRTVSQYATTAGTPSSSNAGRPASGSASGPSGWGYFEGNNASAAPGFNDGSQNAAASHFGGDGGRDRAPGNDPPTSTVRNIIGRTGSSLEENIVVTLMPGKEGMFMFQHHNYEVASQRRGSKVIRRYSDFVWLLDCLQKRYPFRILPLLPPKRVAVNGNHLSNDGAFIEKRRRGLARFLNALVRHPTLSQEQLVVMFLTVPTELAVWRKQATISVQDEFTDRELPPGLEDSLPSTLEDLFTRTRSGVRRSAELYINVCNIMDRLVKRTEGVAADHARIAMSLSSLTETSTDTYATDTNEVPLLNDGLVAMSKHLRTCQTLMEDESRGWDEGVLEDLKRQRDALVSVRELFDRRERLDKDNIPYLERRIQANETKLANLRSKPDGMVKPGEIEKDKESIVQQHNRSIFVKECLRDELITFQTTQYHVSRWNQDWAGERVKYAEMLADNWRRLLDELEGMPLGD